MRLVRVTHGPREGGGVTAAALLWEGVAARRAVLQ